MEPTAITQKQCTLLLNWNLRQYRLDNKWVSDLNGIIFEYFPQCPKEEIPIIIYDSNQTRHSCFYQILCCKCHIFTQHIIVTDKYIQITQLQSCAYEKHSFCACVCVSRNLEFCPHFFVYQ